MDLEGNPEAEKRLARAKLESLERELCIQLVGMLLK
jgi:hypothetical protein